MIIRSSLGPIGLDFGWWGFGLYPGVGLKVGGFRVYGA